MDIYLYPFSEPQDANNVESIIRFGNCPHLAYVQDPRVFIMLDEFLDELRKMGVFSDFFSDFFWSREHVSFFAAMINQKIDELIAVAEIDAKRGKKRFIGQLRTLYLVLQKRGQGVLL